MNHKVDDSLCHRRYLTAVSNVWEAVMISLFWALNRLNKLQEMCSLFPFNLTGKSTMAFLKDQYYYGEYSNLYTAGEPEQGFWCCFTDFNQKFSCVYGAG